VCASDEEINVYLETTIFSVMSKQSLQNILLDYESLNEPLISRSAYDLFYGTLSNHKTTQGLDVGVSINEIITEDGILGVWDTS
jgi:hypothetical protein